LGDEVAAGGAGVGVGVGVGVGAGVGVGVGVGVRGVSAFAAAMRVPDIVATDATDRAPAPAIAKRRIITRLRLWKRGVQDVRGEAEQARVDFRGWIDQTFFCG